MSDMKHTPEPWHITPHPEWGSANARIDADADSAWGNFGQIAYANPANARRIVACVNACAGMDTRELETYKIKELLIKYQREVWALVEDRKGIIFSILDTIGGEVEGRPTSTLNYLQRLRELTREEKEKSTENERLRAEIAKLKAEREELREALVVAKVVLFDTRDDWRVVAGEESIIWIRVDNAVKVASAALERIKEV